MVKRLYFPLVTLFWVTMNVLLWRSEMGGSGQTGGQVPLAMVWQKVLTAPDDSSLQCSSRGRRVGYCRWAPNVGEELATGKAAQEEELPTGQVRKLANYTLDLDGNVLLGEGLPQRARFTWHAELGGDQSWRRMNLRVVVRPTTVDLRADVKAQTVEFRLEGPSGTWARTFTFNELSRPETLLGALRLASGLDWLPELRLPQAGSANPAFALGLQWTAREDWLTVGQTRLRVYRLQARLLDKYQAVILVSRVGEVLRVELPEGFVLANEALNW